MQKNILAILAACLVLSSCLTTTTKPQINPCAEKQMVADRWKVTIKEIGDLAALPTERNVRSLVRPLWKNFNLDDTQCQGYTEQIRDASKKVIRKRADEITSTLLQICGRKTDDEIKDVGLMAAMQEERMGAKEALIILSEPTVECLAN